MAGQSYSPDRDHAQLLARLDDFLRLADRGRISASSFLTPAERHAAQTYLSANGASERFCFWGGYPTAERVCLYLLPDFYDKPRADSNPVLPQGFDPSFDSLDTNPALTLPIPERLGVAAVRITGSGYRKMSHRDYLGAALHLGLERDAIGDIVVLSDREALVFCLDGMAPFLAENLTRIANDTVTATIDSPPDDFAPDRTFADVSDTIASGRLDCIVAALANLSRDAAAAFVRDGMVDVDFEPELRPDRQILPPAILSVRSVGRFRILPYEGETRKGRLRLHAKKYL